MPMLTPRPESWGFKKHYQDNTGLLHDYDKGLDFIKCFVIIMRDGFRFDLGSVVTDITLCWELLSDETDFVNGRELPEQESE